MGGILRIYQIETECFLAIVYSCKVEKQLPQHVSVYVFTAKRVNIVMQ